LIADDVYQII
jgi:ribonucleoside-diphosphate reductase alpha chain